MGMKGVHMKWSWIVKIQLMAAAVAIFGATFFFAVGCSDEDKALISQKPRVEKTQSDKAAKIQVPDTADDATGEIQQIMHQVSGIDSAPVVTLEDFRSGTYRLKNVTTYYSNRKTLEMAVTHDLRSKGHMSAGDRIHTLTSDKILAGDTFAPSMIVPTEFRVDHAQWASEATAYYVVNVDQDRIAPLFGTTQQPEDSGLKFPLNHFFQNELDQIQDEDGVYSFIWDEHDYNVTFRKLKSGAISVMVEFVSDVAPGQEPDQEQSFVLVYEVG
jgi:hypothetical protein